MLSLACAAVSRPGDAQVAVLWATYGAAPVHWLLCVASMSAGGAYQHVIRSYGPQMRNCL